MTVSVNITGLEPIAAAVDKLAMAISGQHVTAAIKDKELTDQMPQSAPVPVTPPIQQPIQPVPVIPQTPIAPPVQQPIQPQPVPMQQATPQPAPVPTSSKTYTADDLAKAATTLMDSGRQEELLNLLGNFGVSTLPDLPPEQFGAFATALRGMGAQI